MSATSPRLLPAFQISGGPFADCSRIACIGLAILRLKVVEVVFNLFKKKTPLQVLEKEYATALEHARDLQRKGDIIGFSEASAEADEILKQIDALEKPQSKANG